MSLALTLWGQQEANAQLLQLCHDVGRTDLVRALQSR